jgi:hypothetical protein
LDYKDVLVDMLQNFSFGLHRTIRDLPKEALQWQPDPQANNINVTVWHICRALDLLKVRIIENRADRYQLWYENGWAARTGYDPTGLGNAGFGNLSGYTFEQVRAVPLLSADESLEYFDQVCSALEGYLAGMDLKALEEPPAGWPSGLGASSPESVYVVLMMFLLDNREHLGEIKAIRAMWQRTRVT